MPDAIENCPCRTCSEIRANDEVRARMGAPTLDIKHLADRIERLTAGLNKPQAMTPQEAAERFYDPSRDNKPTPAPFDPHVAQKHDASKNRLDLFPAAALRRTSEILTFGAKKPGYGPWNWAKGIHYHRLYRAAIGHLLDWFEGNDPDPESGKSHLDHAACCIAFLQHYESHPEVYAQFDDRVDVKGYTKDETHTPETQPTCLGDQGASEGRADGSD